MVNRRPRAFPRTHTYSAHCDQQIRPTNAPAWRWTCVRRLRRASPCNDQPIVDISDCRPAGYKAPLRWMNPTDGQINPSTLVPLAKQAAVITQEALAAIGTDPPPK